ncbi:MAG TPA: response regulator [Bacteroidia bacterium]|nr:response regulator [Bacteroidia bacterium]
MTHTFKKIFVVDDNDIDRYIITSIVSRFNFSKEALEFNMAQKALDWLEENKSNPAALPEIILLDINMPEMNGFEFLDAFEHFPDEVKKQSSVIILTSSNNPDDSERAAKCGLVCAYIHKPLNEEKLKKINERVNGASAEAA